MTALASWIVVAGVVFAGIGIAIALVFWIGADVYEDAPPYDDEEPE